MYAHQALDSMRSIAYGNRFVRSDDIKSLEDMGILLLKMIPEAHKFHLGNLDELAYAVGLSGKTLFVDPNIGRLPYKLCWFDGYTDDGKKFAALAEETKSNHIRIVSFAKPSRDIPWIFAPVVCTAKLGEEIDGGNVFVSSLISSASYPPGFDSESLTRMFVYALGSVESAIRFLNCQNISSEVVKPSTQLNKKRIRNGKTPIFSYKVLVVKIGKKYKKVSLSHSLHQNRLHTCRGHFKEYTEDSPLFGHVVGRFWWQAHVRGSKKKGVILKRYELEQ